MGKRSSDVVRCVECRHEYELPPVGEEMGCPDCGCISWVSARIPSGALEHLERRRLA